MPIFCRPKKLEKESQKRYASTKYVVLITHIRARTRQSVLGFSRCFFFGAQLNKSNLVKFKHYSTLPKIGANLVVQRFGNTMQVDESVQNKNHVTCCADSHLFVQVMIVRFLISHPCNCRGFTEDKIRALFLWAIVKRGPRFNNFSQSRTLLWQTPSNPRKRFCFGTRVYSGISLKVSAFTSFQGQPYSPPPLSSLSPLFFFLRSSPRPWSSSSRTYLHVPYVWVHFHSVVHGYQYHGIIHPQHESFYSTTFSLIPTLSMFTEV